MTDLDLKDWKILYELDVDSRQSFKAIARKVGLSKDSVIYRINKLQADGVVKRFHTVIDVGKLGLISFRLYLKFQNTTPEKEAEMIEFLKKQEIVTWIASAEGEYDLAMAIFCPSISEMNALWRALLRKFRGNIERRWLTIFTTVRYFPRAYFLDKKQNFDEYVFVTEPVKPAVDKKDIKILEQLAGDARMPVIEIAKKSGLTPKTVIARIKNLEKENVIIGYRTMFDLEKLGYQYFKLHLNMLHLSEEKERELRQFIKAHPNIVYDNEVLGGDDIEIEIQCKTIEEFRKILGEIKEKFSGLIKNYRYFLFYKEHKYVFFPTV
jgi:Lrp/AsnC family leucine-responsive transcriptional regulator